MSPGEQAASAARERERERERALRPGSPEHKKLKRDTEVSDGEKSDQDLVVDDANDGSSGAANGNHHSPRENGIDGKKSPGSESSSGGKKKDDSGKKSSLRSTPTTKPLGTVPPIPGYTFIKLLLFLSTKILSQSKIKDTFQKMEEETKSLEC